MSVCMSVCMWKTKSEMLGFLPTFILFVWCKIKIKKMTRGSAVMSNVMFNEISDVRRPVVFEILKRNGKFGEICIKTGLHIDLYFLVPEVLQQESLFVCVLSVFCFTKKIRNMFGDYCLHSGTFYDRVILVE